MFPDYTRCHTKHTPTRYSWRQSTIRLTNRASRSPIGTQPGSEVTESHSSTSNVTVNANVVPVSGLTEQRPSAQSKSGALVQQLPANNHNPQTIMATPDLSILQLWNHRDHTDASTAASMLHGGVNVPFIGNSQFRLLNVARLSQGFRFRSQVQAYVLDKKTYSQPPIPPLKIIALQVIGGRTRSGFHHESNG